MLKCIFLLLIFCLLPFHPAELRAENSENRLSLPESIHIALEKSPSIRSAQESYKGSNYERKAARTDFFPKLGTEFGYTRFNEDPHMKTSEADQIVYPTDFKTGRKDRYQWNTYLKQPIFTGGALKSSYQIAKLNMDLAKENLSRTRQDIILQVKTAFFNILKAEKIKEVAIQAVEQVKSHVDVSQAFYEEEMIPKNELLEAQVRNAQVKQNLIRADNGVQVAKSYFNIVLRRNVNEPVDVEDILEYHSEAFSLEECMMESKEKRPEIREALINLERSQKAVSLSKSRYYPTLSLVADYQKMGDEVDLRGNPYEDSETWMVSTILSWDVWEWGKKHYQVSASKTKVSQAEQQLKQVEDIVALEVKEAWLNYREAEKNIFVAKTAIEQAQENFRLNQERFNEQMATTTDVLDAQTLLTEAQNNYYNALSDYHIAKARLEWAMGRE